MDSHSKKANGLTLSVLHAAFALTGILHTVGGALLPSLAASVHLSDKQSGSLFLLYYAGTATGALLCVGRYSRLMGFGFLLVATTCATLGASAMVSLEPIFLLLGIGVGIPMSAVSIIAGQRFADRTAAPLTFLNFSWSLGALCAPLLAARLLVHRNYQAAYGVLAVAAVLAAVACWLLLDDGPKPLPKAAPPSPGNLRWIALVALLTFLEVGIENTTATWLATYVMRSQGSGAALAAASSSLYWGGFLASRALSSFLLLRVKPMRVLAAVVVMGIVASSLLLRLSGAPAQTFAMLAMGAALAPIFPLLLSSFFVHARDAGDSRWVLAFCGFGGSVVPWVTGAISVRTGSLRTGLLLIPAGLAGIALMLPVLAARRTRVGSGEPEQI